jgi:iron(III) transport system ATP-binding protein
LISLSNLVKTYHGNGSGDSKSHGAGVVAVDDISIEIKSGELFTLLGPSGCGKTTTLRMLAGLTTPDSGVIAVHDMVLFDGAHKIDVPPHRRGLGMVFQSYAIWPHMTVAKNVAFPLTRRSRHVGHMKKAEIDARVREVLGLVQLDGLENRPATDLSGGQQQRLALARALATQPQVLLLDEPLSNLDAKLRELMRFELKRIQRGLGITTVYVTHDQTEALGMSNRIAVMNAGRVEQIGHPRDIYERPESHFVADFIGVSNFIQGTVKERVGDGRWLILSPHGDLIADSSARVAAGDDVTISVRPEHIGMVAVERHGDPARNVLFGSVTTRAFQGDSVQHQVQVGDLTVRVQCHPSDAVNTGSAVELRLPEQWCSIIPGFGSARTVGA